MRNFFVTVLLVISACLTACAGALSADVAAPVDLDTQVGEAILDANAGQYPPSDFATQAHVTLKTVESRKTVTVYAMALYLEFVYADGGLTVTGGSHMPVAITFKMNAEGAYD